MPSEPTRPASLEPEEAARLVSSRWRVEGGELVTEVRCADFAAALALANRIGAIAEELGHHPDLTVGWGRLGVRCSTHSIGGLSGLDVELAGRVDEVVDAASQS